MKKHIILIPIIAALLVIYMPEIAKVIKQADSIKTEKKAMVDELVRLEVERLKREAEAAKTAGNAPEEAKKYEQTEKTPEK